MSSSSLPDYLCRSLCGQTDSLEERAAMAEGQFTLMDAIRVLYSDHPDPQFLWLTLVVIFALSRKSIGFFQQLIQGVSSSVPVEPERV
ncbi:MAG: hypothetical protein OXF20_06860 [Gammaproteobacteria bacterium]|nr:hypothetical protein [Gammaproteobacteria bacterium]